jgi:phage terminase large subunit
MFNPNLVFIDQNIKDARIIALQGGTRSGKTHSALRWVIRQANMYKGNLTYSVVRQTLTALKATALRDFIEITTEANMYSEAFHNKTENTYHLNGNMIEFFGVDDEQKVRGRKRQLLYVNEANELTLEQWRQLLFRTEGKVIIDYNPSMSADHWIFKDVLTRDDCRMIITTYKDNPHLTPETVAEIDRLKDIDPEYYKVFGLGLRGEIKGQIFSNFTECEGIPTDAKYLGSGMDFGFTNDPTAVVDVYQQNGELWVDEVLYRTALTNSDINALIKHRAGKRYVCDSAEPKSIEELRRMGLNVEAAKKGPDSVKASIDILKRYRINITKGSANLLKEMRQYKWRVSKNTVTKEDQTMNEPVDFNNHAVDALRYLALNKLSNPSSGKYAIVGGRG